MAQQELHAMMTGMDRAAVIAFDPGLTPGLAWLAADGQLLGSRVLGAEELERLRLPAGVPVAVGNGTGSRALLKRLGRLGISADTVDETGSSLEARRLYWQVHRAPGLLRFVPLKLRPVPPGLDAYAAWVIGRRWLAAQRQAGTGDSGGGEQAPR